MLENDAFRYFSWQVLLHTKKIHENNFIYDKHAAFYGSMSLSLNLNVTVVGHKVDF